MIYATDNPGEPAIGVLKQATADRVNLVADIMPNDHFNDHDLITIMNILFLLSTLLKDQLECHDDKSIAAVVHKSADRCPFVVDRLDSWLSIRTGACIGW